MREGGMRERGRDERGRDERGRKGEREEERRAGTNMNTVYVFAH